MGYPLFTWPVTITSAAAAIRVGIGGSDETLSFTAGTYRWLSGGADDFGSALDTLLDTHAGADVATQTLSDKRSQPGWVTLTCTTTIELLWEHGDVTLPAAVLGWTATDTSAVTSLQSPYPPQGVWLPHVYATDDRPMSHIRYARHQALAPAVSVTRIHATWTRLEVILDWVAPWRVLQDHADDSTYATASGSSFTAGDPNIALESSLWAQIIAGTGVYYHQGGGSGGDGPYYLIGDTIDLGQIATVEQQAGTFYRVRMELAK